MDRRTLVKQVLATAAVGAAAPKIMLGDANQRSYESATISVRLVEGGPGRTLVALFEHGDADYAIVEAFYWAKLDGLRLMLHKEVVSTLVQKEVGSAADLPLPLSEIVFIKVRELKSLNLVEFGKVPK